MVSNYYWQADCHSKAAVAVAVSHTIECVLRRWWDDVLTDVLCWTGGTSCTEKAAGGQGWRCEKTTRWDRLQSHGLEQWRFLRKRWETGLNDKCLQRLPIILFSEILKLLSDKCLCPDLYEMVPCFNSWRICLQTHISISVFSFWICLPADSSFNIFEYWYLSIPGKDLNKFRLCNKLVLFHIFSVHPDETLRKRLKEKRKGGFYVCVRNAHCTHVLFAWTSMSHLSCLSIITHWSAYNCSQSQTLLNWFKIENVEVVQGPVSVFLLSVQPQTATGNVCFRDSNRNEYETCLY